MHRQDPMAFVVLVFALVAVLSLFVVPVRLICGETRATPPLFDATDTHTQSTPIGD
jgi:hypothetical protein